MSFDLAVPVGVIDIERLLESLFECRVADLDPLLFLLVDELVEETSDQRSVVQAGQFCMIRIDVAEMLEVLDALLDDFQSLKDGVAPKVLAICLAAAEIGFDRLVSLLAELFGLHRCFFNAHPGVVQFECGKILNGLDATKGGGKDCGIGCCFDLFDRVTMARPPSCTHVPGTLTWVHIAA